MSVSDANSMPQPPKKQTQLIVFGGHGNVNYFDGCKIVINAIKQLLTVISNDENAKAMIANFDQDIIYHNNILFAFSSFEQFHGFALIFQSEKTCQNIYENIQKRKNPQTIDKSEANKSEVFKKHFFTPIFKEIENTEKFESQLTEIILNFLKSLSIEEGKQYLNILKINNSKLLNHESFAKFTMELKNEAIDEIPKVNNSLPNNNSEMDVTPQSLKDGNLTSILKSPFGPFAPNSKMDISMNDSALSETNESFENDRRRSLRKRPLQKLNYSFDYGIDDSGSDFDGSELDDESPLFKKRASEDIFKDNEIVKSPNFEIKEYIEYGKQRKKLIIFTSDDKKQSYAYNYDKKGKLFYCFKCAQQKHWVRADIFCDEKGKDYIRLGSISHKCEPIEFLEKNYMDIIPTIIKLPHFKIIKRKFQGKFYSRLVIFNAENKNLCREYAWAENNKKYYCGPCHNKNMKNRYIFAKLIENENEEPYVELSPETHLCEEREYNFDESGEIYSINNVPLNDVKKIIPSDVFKIEIYIKAEKERKRLIIYDENDKSLGYVYHYANCKKKFVCNGCCLLKKHVIAKLHQNENGQEFIELGLVLNSRSDRQKNREFV